MLTPGELMIQASMTAHEYMSDAVVRIDQLFGAGYAEEHPALVAAFMQTAAHDFDTCMRHEDHLQAVEQSRLQIQKLLER
jgi:hypothetical protein